MHIDKKTGVVRFSNGLEFGPDLTQERLRQFPLFREARAQDYGTPPWIHFHFAGGELQAKPVLVSLCFYDQVLVFAEINADLYPPGPMDWSKYSLKIEAETKEIHDAWLEKNLGMATSQMDSGMGNPASERSVLDRTKTWKFSWGIVVSSHDFKGGGTSIIVRYGDRMEEANLAYRARIQPGN